MAVTGGFCPLPWRLGGDAATGLTAAQHARKAADLVAQKRTSPLAWFTWTGPGAPSMAATITAYGGMNGSGPGFAPTASAASGRLVFLWTPGRFTDDYQVSAPIKPIVALVTFAGTTYRRAVALLRPNGVEITAYDAAGSAVNPQPDGTCVLW